MLCKEPTFHSALMQQESHRNLEMKATQVKQVRTGFLSFYPSILNHFSLITSSMKQGYNIRQKTVLQTQKKTVFQKFCSPSAFKISTHPSRIMSVATASGSVFLIPSIRVDIFVGQRLCISKSHHCQSFHWYELLAVVFLD